MLTYWWAVGENTCGPTCGHICGQSLMVNVTRGNIYKGLKTELGLLYIASKLIFK